MFKKLLSSGVGIAFLMMPVFASALTLADLQSQLADALARLRQFQSQQGQVLGETTVACPTITKRLALNSVDTQVVALKQYLTTIGIMPANQFTTYFGPLTEAALQKWQCKKGIVCSGTPATTGYGATGPLTRAALKNCGASTNVPPGGVTTPIGIPPVQPPPVGGGSNLGGGSSVPAPITYMWNSGAWSQCVNSSQSRSVSCISSANANVPESLCASSKPPVTQSCTDGTQPAQCIPLQPETRTQACPAGQVGSISQRRVSACPGPTWSDWQTTENTCATPPNNTQSCTLDGLTIAHNATQTFYSSQSVAYGSLCSSVAQSRTCTNGVFSGADTYRFASCTPAQPLSCTFNGSTIAHGASVTANLTSTVQYGQQCTTQIRTCTNGVLSGTYTYASCAVGAPQACLLDGVTVNHAASQTFYSAQTVPYGQNCSAVAQSRTCQNGTLSGNSTYQYATCAATQPLSCTFNNQTFTHGASVTAYQSATVAYGNQCVSETRSCNNGVLSGSYTNPSCAVGTAASCTFNGQTVANGASVTAYQSSTVPAGQQCVSQSRTCTNGTLSGTYTNTSCTVQTLSNAVQPAGLPTRTLSVAEYGNSMQDFLISDVCVDANDQPIVGDPATCSNHRDLKFGEYVPYLRTDKQSGVAQQASISFPVQALDGTLLAIKSFDFGSAMGGASFRDYDVGGGVLYKYDGYDLREANGAWTSIIASRDYDGWKRMWGPGCTHNDTWLYFPTGVQKGQTGNLNNDLNFTVDSATCPTVFGTALTVWNWYATPVTYTSGKSLESIVTWHFNSPDPAQITNFEQFYNTRTYGGTRWEAWSTTGPEDTTGSCNGASHAEFYGKTMYRTACRDWTYTQSVDVPISPLASTMGDDLVFSQNLLQRGDFAQGAKDAWKTWEASGASVSVTLKKNADNNSYVEVMCATNNCNSAILYQDVANLAQFRGATELRVGGMIKTSTPATTQVTVYLVKNDGSYAGQKSFDVINDGTWRNFGGLYTVNLSSDVAWIRYQIAVQPGVTYSLDDLYLTPAK